MLPWAEMMRAATLQGLAPRDFWACSVREWIWLSGPAAPGLDRMALEQLAQRFPDTKGD